MKMPEDVAGATLMAIGSSAPEFFTSLFAVFSVTSEVGPGTIVGSAIFNILVITGASAIVSKAILAWKPVLRDILFYLFSILLLYFTFKDGTITLIEAVTYLFIYFIYIGVLYIWSRRSKEQVVDELEEISEEAEEIEEALESGKNFFGRFLKVVDRLIDKTFPNLKKRPELYLLTFIVSLVYIIGLSWVLVESAVHLSEILGIPAVIISLTVLAAGTSIPDLLSSIIVARSGRSDMAISNAVGSNVFDILIGLGFPWFIYLVFVDSSLNVGTENLVASILLLLFTVFFLFAIFIIRKFHVGKPTGYVLITLYLGYLVYAIFEALG